MDTDLSQILLQDSSKTLCNFDLASACSDAGYFSACSSLSPTSSVDSCGLSPPAFRWDSVLEQESTAFDCQAAKKPKLQFPAPKPVRSRSKYPGKKRQNASEREKLRMRDLTKALHHLRSYLPPSVAPSGQSLTKIEILRRTIRYISYLSAQLNPSEGTSSQDKPMGYNPDVQERNQNSSMRDVWPQQELSSVDQTQFFSSTSSSNSTQTVMQSSACVPSESAETPGSALPADNFAGMLYPYEYFADSFLQPYTENLDCLTPIPQDCFAGYY